MRQVLLSKHGMGMQKVLWVVWPPRRRIAAMPVIAEAITLRLKALRQWMMKVYRYVLPLPRDHQERKPLKRLCRHGGGHA